VFSTRATLRALLSRLIAPLRGKPAKRHGPAHVLVYSRADCHLCELAWEQLQRARRRFHFTLEKIDISSDAELTGRFGDQVPVVCVDGEVRFRGRVNEVLLMRLLEGKADR
jgi:hypothetical protein